MPKRKEPPADPARFEEAISAFRKRVPMKREEWDKLTTAQRERAFMVSEVALADLITEVYEGIGKAIEKGTRFEEFKETAGKKLTEHWGGEKPGRIQTIFRTNVMANYSAGREAIISAPVVREARPYVRYDGIDDDVQTDICYELDGTVHPADSDFVASRTPPLHHNCRTIKTPLTAEEAEEEGITDTPPDVTPAKGFGAAPSEAGADWTPEMIGYPTPVREVLKGRLKKKGG